VGDGGYCKHTAALLMTWLREPETFMAVEEIDAALERRSKEELIALIQQMLRQRPDLETLLEVPLATGAPRQTPVSADVYRRQAAAALGPGEYDDYEYGWGSAFEGGRELGLILANGDTFLRQGDYEAATAVYAGVAAEVTERYEMVEDEEGALDRVVARCVDGLGACLRGERANTEIRAEIIEALYGIERSGMGYEEVAETEDDMPTILARDTTPDERAMVAEWVRDALPAGNDWGATYQRRSLGAFLLQLEADTLDDEAFLRICRETGRTYELIDRLLTLGRTDEAVEATGAVNDFEMIELASLFVRHGEDETAARLMEARVATTNDARVTDWLKEFRLEHGDDAGALDLAMRLFTTMPHYERYAEIRAITRRLNRWDEVRPGLIAHLQSREDRDLLMRIHLDEGEIDRAVALARAAAERPSSAYVFGGYSAGYGTPMTLEVARAVEETHPRDALYIYRRHAERLIDARGRERYQEACRYLAKVRGLYDALDEYDAWERYLAALREQHARLRALKEEMIAADLIA
jgi:uncharacterized Zn finger protein